MRISNRGLDLIKDFEGCRLTAYKCPAGVWTIGYGHTKGVREGMVITLRDAENYLLDDVAPAESAVRWGVAPGLQQCEFDALVSFTFNLGAANLKKSTLLKRINSGYFGDELEEEFMKWVKVKSGGQFKAAPGLVRRRAAEWRLFREGRG